LAMSYHSPPPSDTYTLSLHDALPISAAHGEEHGQREDHRHGPPEVGIDAGQEIDRLLPQRAQEVVAYGGAEGQDAGTEVEPQRRSEEHTSELQSREKLVCRLLLEKKK